MQTMARRVVIGFRQRQLLVPVSHVPLEGRWVVEFASWEKNLPFAPCPLHQVPFTSPQTKMLLFIWFLSVSLLPVLGMHPHELFFPQVPQVFIKLWTNAMTWNDNVESENSSETRVDSPPRPRVFVEDVNSHLKNPSKSTKGRLFSLKKNVFWGCFLKCLRKKNPILFFGGKTSWLDDSDDHRVTCPVVLKRCLLIISWCIWKDLLPKLLQSTEVQIFLTKMANLGIHRVPNADLVNFSSKKWKDLEFFFGMKNSKDHKQLWFFLRTYSNTVETT